MKPPLPAVLYGTSLLLAFGAGWFFKPASSPDNAAALSHPAPPAKRSGPPIPQKPANALAGSGKHLLEAALADIDTVRAARQPGVANPVLIERLRGILSLTDEKVRLSRWQSLITEMRTEDVPALSELFITLFEDGRWFEAEGEAFDIQYGRIAGALAAESHATGDKRLFGILRSLLKNTSDRPSA